MKTMPVGKGRWTVVDDDDYERFAVERWHLSKGYVRRNVFKSKGKTETLILHRLVAGAKPGEVVDHIDKDKLNNRKSNLKIRPGHSDHSTHHNRTASPRVTYKGVTFKPQRLVWVARITDKGVSRYLGEFVDPVDAAEAYNEAASRIFGSGCYLNPINRDKKNPWEVE